MDYIECWHTMGVDMEQPQKDKPRCAVCKKEIPAACLDCCEMEATLYRKRRFHISMTEKALCGTDEPLLACYPESPTTCCRCWSIVREMSQHKGGLIILKRILKEHGVDTSDFSKVMKFVTDPKNDPSERK